MTNLECAVAVLAAHREARAWTDTAVATDLMAQLGLDPKGDAKNAKTVPDPLEAEVAAAETAAKEATAKAAALRAKLLAAQKPAASAVVPPAKVTTPADGVPPATVLPVTPPLAPVVPPPAPAPVPMPPPMVPQFASVKEP